MSRLRQFRQVVLDIVPSEFGPQVHMQINAGRTSLSGFFNPLDAMEIATILGAHATMAQAMRDGLAEGVTVQ